MSFDRQTLPHEVVIPSDLHVARRVEEDILRAVASVGYSREDRFAIRLALEEAIVNAHKHGNRSDPTRTITISYAIDAHRVIVRVRDEGGGFAFRTVPDPTSPDRLSVPSGRGIMLMRAYVDGIEYNERGNEVQLVKKNTRVSGLRTEKPEVHP